MPLIKQEDLNGLNTTDYTLQNIKEHRKRMVGRYSYLFTKPLKEMTGFEQGLYWYLRIEGYQDLNTVFNDDDIINWERIRRLENKADMILQTMKIPFTLIEHYALIEKQTDRSYKITKIYTVEDKDIYT